MTTFFISDLHLSHSFVSKLRGFDSTEDHDDWIVKQWNSKVSPYDEVWLLGDISLKKVVHFEGTLQRLRGKINVVLGNHCTSHPIQKGWQGQWKLLMSQPNIEWVGTEALVRYDGFRFRLSHFPFATDLDHGETARFDVWRPQPSKDMVLVHGHSHASEVISQSGIHVGVDALNGVPMSSHELVRLAKEHYGDRQKTKRKRQDV